MERDQRHLRAFANTYARHHQKWAWTDATKAILAAFTVALQRTLRPKKTVRPHAINAETELLPTYHTVPAAQLGPFECGWAGLIGLTRTVLVAAHSSSLQLKRALGLRAVPLVSWYTMWEQLGIRIRPVLRSPDRTLPEALPDALCMFLPEAYTQGEAPRRPSPICERPIGPNSAHHGPVRALRVEQHEPAHVEAHRLPRTPKGVAGRTVRLPGRPRTPSGHDALPLGQLSAGQRGPFSTDDAQYPGEGPDR